MLFSFCLITNLQAATRAFPGFVTANEYRALSVAEKYAYSAGLIDGLLASPILLEDEIRQLEDCVTGMSNSQMSAIFDQYISDKPGTWHESMSVHAVFALIEKGQPCASYIFDEN